MKTRYIGFLEDMSGDENSDGLEEVSSDSDSEDDEVSGKSNINEEDKVNRFLDKISQF